MVTPLDRVGLYVPGGKAAYPSSVLMNAIPAKVAGVGELIMVVPTPDGEEESIGLGRRLSGRSHRVFAIGGAQAVAAPAYGTARVPQVDKIVGPGMPTWPPPSAASSASSVSTWSPAPRKSSWCRTVPATPTGWRWISSPRPSTTNWPSPSSSAPTRLYRPRPGQHRQAPAHHAAQGVIETSLTNRAPSSWCAISRRRLRSPTG